MHAVRHSYVDNFKRLIRISDVTSRNCLSFLRAAMNGDQPVMVEFLIDRYRAIYTANKGLVGGILLGRSIGPFALLACLLSLKDEEAYIALFLRSVFTDDIDMLMLLLQHIQFEESTLENAGLCTYESSATKRLLQMHQKRCKVGI
jgi:hypothetical protein